MFLWVHNYCWKLHKHTPRYTSLHAMHYGREVNVSHIYVSVGSMIWTWQLVSYMNLALVCVKVCVCVHVYMCVCMHMCTYAYTCVCVSAACNTCKLLFITMNWRHLYFTTLLLNRSHMQAHFCIDTLRLFWAETRGLVSTKRLLMPVAYDAKPKDSTCTSPWPQLSGSKHCRLCACQWLQSLSSSWTPEPYWLPPGTTPSLEPWAGELAETQVIIITPLYKMQEQK